MEKILVHDNFLNKEELDKCIGIINDNTWKWNHTSDGSRRDTPFWNMDLCENQYFSKYLKDIIERHFSKKFILKRVYANAQTYGQDGTYHVDSDNKNDYTFCLYLTNIKEENVETAGGHLFFKLPEVNYKICYEPKFNRGIFFPSNYIHKGNAFSRYIMDLRISIAWKLEEIQ
jgi:Rps23 Pro-64 3,4-dihydroxylase Tpa1-like proline 4-hydroxylase